jgi:flagellar secretion chaperone FliS
VTRDAAQAYRIQSVLTASPARQVALLLDRAIASLKEACRAIDAGEIEQRCKANGRAMEIVGQLAMALDFEQGRDIAANLDKLYRFMLMRLPSVDLLNDAQAARDVIGLLEPLRRSWHEVADRLAEESRAESAARQAPAVGETAKALASRLSVSA